VGSYKNVLGLSYNHYLGTDALRSVYMCKTISLFLIFLMDLVEEFTSARLAAISEMTGALLVG
jgi:hypothetical protein